jgi:ATP-dependent RNA helicase DDX5/DBP2
MFMVGGGNANPFDRITAGGGGGGGRSSSGGGFGFGGGAKGLRKARKENTPFNDISNGKDDDHEDAPPHVSKWRKENTMRTQGGASSKPWLRYSECPLPDNILRDFRHAGYKEPSVIQAQAWPDALAGRDCVGVAKTGSGKTLAFLIPAFLKISKNRPDPRQGPSVLVLAPTRELAMQIREEVVKFGRSSGVQSTCVYGGAPKNAQLGDLRRGVHVVRFFSSLMFFFSNVLCAQKSNVAHNCDTTVTLL